MSERTTRRAAPAVRDDHALARRMRAGDRRARHELIVSYLPFARALALRYRRRADPIEDLLQVAALGLVNAVDRWDPERGVELTSYATPTILGELRHYFRDRTWGIRPPRALQDLSSAAVRAQERLQAQLGRSPTIVDLSRALGADEDAVAEALQVAANRMSDSLDAPLVGEDQERASLGSLLGVSDPELERVEERLTIDRLTTVLDARAREILRLRYEEDLLQTEIAARLGWSQMQVSRALRAALDRLNAYATAPRRATPGPTA